MIKKIRLAGLFILIGMTAGIFSVAPAIDSTDYLIEASKHSHQVIIAAVFQFILSLAYMAFAILVYPVAKRFGGSLALGFFSFRVLAVCFSLFGTILLLSILTLSEVFVQNDSQNTLVFETLGTIFKSTRDAVNHIFMVLLLCAGNIMLYFLFIKARLLAQWLLIWGICGSVLSVIASLLLLFEVVAVITPEYLLLNVPTALFELCFGIRLMVKGLDKDKLGSGDI